MSGGDKCKLMRPKEPRVGDKWETSVKSGAPRHPEWETSVGDKWKTSVNSCGPRHPSVRDKWETSVKSCGPRHPEWPSHLGALGRMSLHLSPPDTCLSLWVPWAA